MDKINLSDIDLSGIEGELYDRLTALFGALATQNTADIAQFVRGAIVTITAASYSVMASDVAMIANRAGTVTLTFPAANLNAGRILFVRTITANTVVSASGNVIPLAGGAAGTAILAATAGKWALLWSDGTNWQIQAAN